MRVASASGAGRSGRLLGFQHLASTASKPLLIKQGFLRPELQELPPPSALPSGDFLFEAAQRANQLVADQLDGVTPVTYCVVLAAGLATSLSPCTLSVLPLTIGYIAGYSSSGASSDSSRGSSEAGQAAGPVQQRSNTAVQAIAFSAGLATTLAALGVFSSLAGQAYGQIGDGLPIAVSLVAIAMGLNLLEVLPLQLPSLDVDVKEAAAGVPPPLQAYLAGLVFALAASPCSTPVLATLLAWVASSGDPIQGGSLLLAYTTGYVAPLLVAATVTGSVKRLLALRRYSAWLTPASGVLLVGGGTYSLLSRLV